MPNNHLINIAQVLSERVNNNQPTPQSDLHITIDGKNTREFDFSQLNPNMIYDRYNHELGSEDAYDRVLDGQHRDVVKQAFNAMLQAENPLNQKPDGINLDEVGLSWKELKEAILASHRPIQDLFFKGIGNRLQF